MSIKVTSINYGFDEDGKTNVITVTMSGYENANTMNTSIQLTGDGLDDLSRTEIEVKARQQASEFVLGKGEAIVDADDVVTKPTETK